MEGGNSGDNDTQGQLFQQAWQAGSDINENDVVQSGIASAAAAILSGHLRNSGSVAGETSLKQRYDSHTDTPIAGSSFETPKSATLVSRAKQNALDSAEGKVKTETPIKVVVKPKVETTPDTQQQSPSPKPHSTGNSTPLGEADIPSPGFKSPNKTMKPKPTGQQSLVQMAASNASATHRVPVTLKDVLSHHPMESQTETQILSAMEEGETGPGLSSSWTNLLNHVTQDAEPAFDVPRRDISQAQSLRRAAHNNSTRSAKISSEGNSRQHHSDHGSTRPSHTSLASSKEGPRNLTHRRTATMEERLDGLNDALEELQVSTIPDEPPVQEIIMAAEAVSESTNAGGSGSANTMNKHAGTLFRRKSRSNVKSSDEAFGTASVPPRTARDRWRLLRDTNAAAHMTPLQAAQAASQKESSHNLGANSAASSLPGIDENEVLETEVNQEAKQKNVNNLRQSAHQIDREQKWHNFFGRYRVVRELETFSEVKQSSVRMYIRIFFLIIVPAVCIAFALYQWADNPPVGRLNSQGDNTTRAFKDGTEFRLNHKGKWIDPSNKASISYWILFVCCRQLITLSFAQAAQLFFIDFLCIGRRWTSEYLGPAITLVIVQSRGWPFLLCTWSMFNFLMNHGTSQVCSMSTFELLIHTVSDLGFSVCAPLDVLARYHWTFQRRQPQVRSVSSRSASNHSFSLTSQSISVATLHMRKHMFVCCTMDLVSA